MRLLLSLIFIAFWQQIVAPVTEEECKSVDELRIYTGTAYPQLCYNVNGILVWSYFCGNFGMKEGKVFCKTLGYPGYVSDEGTSMNNLDSITKIDNLNCFGNETKLTDCSYSETTNSCKVSLGLLCNRCNSNSMCQGGECLMNGTCVCSDNCQNGGYCYAGKCVCPDGFGGPACSECDPQCEHGGVCSASGECQCMLSYSGERCEFNTSITTTTTAMNSTIIPDTSSLTLIIIAVAVPSLIFSCTLIIICFGILAFLAFMMSQMKPFFGGKHENKVENTQMNEITEHRSNNQPTNRKTHEYELEFENSHDYYYIENNKVGQNKSNPFLTSPVKEDHYEIMESSNRSNQTNRVQDYPQSDFRYNNSTSNLIEKDPKSDYVIDDINYS